jgi:hypothetical protein
MDVYSNAGRRTSLVVKIPEEAKRLAVEVQERDGVDLRLRLGVNSGQVIAGEIGSGPFGYTAIGVQVGMAQRMESVAPPGGVMLSASTARLVDKRAESNLVGRRWEMSAVQGLLERAIDGHGAVVGLVGLAGLGKSRLVREVSAMAAARDVEVFTAFCESHTSQISFHAVARLLRAVTGVEGLDPHAARARIRAQASYAEPEDLVLVDARSQGLLGIVVRVRRQWADLLCEVMS